MIGNPRNRKTKIRAARGGLYSIKVTPDLKIPASGETTDSGRYGINEYINAQARMIKMEKEDVVIELVVKRVVFEDNTVLEL